MVPPEIPLFPFPPSLLVAAGGIAELCLIAPVRSERHKPLRLLALIPPQNLLHRAAQIVIPQPLEYPTKVGEGQLVRFQESLLCGARVGNVKRPSAEHAPHAEHLLHLLARSEEHTSELQSRPHLVCRLLLEKKKKTLNITRLSITSTSV